MTKIYKTRLTSSHWGTYRVQTENGRITDLINFECDSDPSPIGKGIIDTHDDKSRISSPMTVSYTHLTLPTSVPV